MKTKQTPHGSSSSHQPKGMAAAKFPSAKAEKKQVKEEGGDESQDSQDWPDMDDPKHQAATEGEGETSKSVGEIGDQPSQAEGGATAPPKENHPAPTDPQAGTSKDPTDKPEADPTQDPTQAAAQNPEEETHPDLTEYIKSYQQAGKQWLDTVLEHKEQTYKTLFRTVI